MIVDRHFSRAVILGLMVATFATACKDKSSSTTTTGPTCAFSVVQPTTTYGPEGGTGSATITVTAGTDAGEVRTYPPANEHRRDPCTSATISGDTTRRT